MHKRNRGEQRYNRWLAAVMVILGGGALALTIIGTSPSDLTGVESNSSAAPSRGSLPGVPATGVLFGSSSEFPSRAASNGVVYDYSDEAYKVHYLSREKLLGRKFDITNRFTGWDATNIRFEKSSRLKWDLEQGRLPMLSWTNGSLKLDAYTNGSQDTYIREQARALKAYNKPIIVRWGWEMNGDWFNWSGAKNNTSATQKDGPAKFKAAWIHVYNLFQQEGATNVQWAWVPAGRSYPNEPWNDSLQFYPGNQYVQWIGADIYNFGTVREGKGGYPATFTQEWDKFYNKYASYGKPMVLAETASSNTANDKVQWINSAQTTIKNNYPMVAAFVYFDRNEDAPDFAFDGPDAKNNNAPAALQAFRNMAKDPYFNTKNYPINYGACPSGQTGTPPFNCTTPPPSPSPTVDLVVTDVNWAPANPLVNNDIKFTATIKNQGNTATPASTIVGVSFMVDGKQVNWSDTQTTPLAAGASVTLTANYGPSRISIWKTATAGAKTVTAYVDDIDRIKGESNENNNTLTKSMLVTTVSVDPVGGNSGGATSEGSTTTPPSKPVTPGKDVVIKPGSDITTPIEVSGGTKIKIDTRAPSGGSISVLVDNKQVKVDQKDAASGQIVIDTAQLTNGTHTVTVYDNKTRQATTQTIIVKNSFLRNVANHARENAVGIAAPVLLLGVLAAAVVRFHLLRLLQQRFATAHASVEVEPTPSERSFTNPKHLPGDVIAPRKDD